MTAFTFYITRDEKSFFGTKRKAKQRPYILLSIAECKAWGEELRRRTGQEEDPEPNQREAEAADDFMERDPKDRSKRGVVYKEEPLTKEEIVGLIRSVVAETLSDLVPKSLKGKSHKRKE